MNCAHFGSCGSCGLHDSTYQEQVKQKESMVAGLLHPFYDGKLEIFESQGDHYRARAEFRIWHEGEVCTYAMGNMKKNGAITIHECPKVIVPIEQRMWRLLEYISNAPQLLKHKLFSVEFLATTTNECLITLLYHKHLDEAWQASANDLEAILDCRIMGRSRKQKIILSNEYVTEKLCIDGKTFIYRQYESGFTQPNPLVNVQMIEWAIAQAKTVGYGDFLESYCGLGNFTLPLSRYFDKVLATEISKRSIQAATENCVLNGAENITFARLASEEMTEALCGVREFSRLKGVDLSQYNFSTVLVDPPRAGLDEGTIALIAGIEHILYISCNPKTLARDLETLSNTHEVVRAAMFDQFPHTSHVESGVFLRKKLGK